MWSIDEGWYMANPDGDNLAERKYQLNANGLLIPDAARFPSAANGAGFRALADWVHAQGLKFGIHIVRGIPRQAVEANMPIAGSSFHAADAADTTATCPWDDGNYGVADNAAGQAYYDSMLRLYASWGVDFLKTDCICHQSLPTHRNSPDRRGHSQDRTAHPAQPFARTYGPGPCSGDSAVGTDVAHQRRPLGRLDLTMRRAKAIFRHGIREAFDLLAKWYPYTGPGSWPDADMLPEGWLGPNPGWGDGAAKPRNAR